MARTCFWTSTTSRRLLFLFVGALLLAACDDFDDSTRDVFVNSDGQVLGAAGDTSRALTQDIEADLTLAPQDEIDRQIERQRVLFEEFGAPLESLGSAISDCGSGGCFEIDDESRIIERLDGRNEPQTIYTINPSAPWWNVTYGDLLNEPEIGFYDIVVAPDGTVGVAAGDLGVITRSPDGEWSRTVADLRTLPQAAILAIFATGLTMFVLLVYAATKNDGTRVARYGLATVGPLALVLFITLGQSVLTFLLLPFSLTGAGFGLSALWRSRSTSGYTRGVLPLIGLGAIVLTVAWSAFYFTWSRDLIGYWAAVLLCLAAFAAVTIGATLRVRMSDLPDGEQRPYPAGDRGPLGAYLIALLISFPIIFLAAQAPLLLFGVVAAGFLLGTTVKYDSYYIAS